MTYIVDIIHIFLHKIQKKETPARESLFGFRIGDSTFGVWRQFRCRQSLRQYIRQDIAAPGIF